MPDTTPHVNPVRQAMRLLAAAALLLAGVLIVGTLFPLLRHSARMRAVHLWSRLLLLALGLRLRLHGATAPAGAALVVANHVSWLDIFVINSWQACRFVAKAEINHWPLIGWLCRHTGTLFISRQRRHDTGRMREQMVHGLARGHTLAVFPEGTTSDGQGLLPFNPSLLQAALDTGSPVVCVTLGWRGHDGQWNGAAAYIDDMSLAQSLCQIVRARGLTVELHIGEAIRHWPEDRRRLAARCEADIRSRLSQL